MRRPVRRPTRARRRNPRSGVDAVDVLRRARAILHGVEQYRESIEDLSAAVHEGHARWAADKERELRDYEDAAADTVAEINVILGERR